MPAVFPPPPLTRERPLWWGVAQPRAPGHLLQLDLHKAPTRGALGDSPEAEGRVPLASSGPKRPEASRGAAQGLAEWSPPLYRGGRAPGTRTWSPLPKPPVRLPCCTQSSQKRSQPSPLLNLWTRVGLGPSDPLLGPISASGLLKGKKSAPTKGPRGGGPCSWVLRYPKHPHPLRRPGSMGVPTCSQQQ